MFSLNRLGTLRGRRLIGLAAGVCFAVLLVAIGSRYLATSSIAAETKRDTSLLQEAQSVFEPLPKSFATATFPTTPERVELGRKLFFDPRISVDGTVSCSRCHLAGLQGTDGLQFPHGAHDKVLPRNAPTLFNTAVQFRQHWRGDFENVEEQAKAALLAMGFANPNYAAAMAKVAAIPGYEALFRDAFPNQSNPITEDNWGTAVGAYERTLVSRARFDDYLAGKAEALSLTEREGLRTFLDVGCADCHRGAGIGGGSFEKFGVVADYAPLTGSKHVDQGRFDLTKRPEDKYVFKVPILRNVALTPPYFHDGSVAPLSEAIRVMAKVQLGDDLTDVQIEKIEAFLKSLNGEMPESYIETPILPTAAFNPAPSSTTSASKGRSAND
ncbi:MAG: cytochrome c peroxidase [Pirellulales bacterium]